ncbi:hypothetical protein [Streptomyces uncialis]|uniref:hypothetical protein n=1 Tax=Streptomyces uncialis TaxID=1048205 RepID=UPI003864E211|nr:hypothetical protein OG924_29625 [Streptomyces uncialis]
MDHRSHFVFGTHPDHGFVATATAHTPIHLADWYLTRETFEQVSGTPGLYRLTRPEQDGSRRTRQAVHDLRAQGFAVYADYSLDPISEPSLSEQLVNARQARLARAAAARSPQLRTTGAPLPVPAPVLGAAATAARRAGRSR